MESQFLSIKRINTEEISDFAIQVQAAGHFMCDASYGIKRKKYDSILIMYTLSGKGHLKYRNQEYIATTNSLVLIDCNEPHEYFSDKNEFWNMMWVHFETHLVTKQVQFILENDGPLQYEVDSDFFKEKLGIILENISQVGVYTDILLSGFIQEMLQVLLLESIKFHAGSEQNIPDPIKNTLNIIQTMYSQNLSLDTLASSLFINKFYMIKKFKKYFGMTPYTYLVKYRIKQAKHFLENSDLSIAEIGVNVGFEDASYFIKTFKAFEKLTPLCYRRLWRKK